MTVANWITLVLFALGTIGAILAAQYRLISGLLKDRWERLENRQQELEDWQEEAAQKAEKLKEDTGTQFRAFDHRLTKVETTCRLQHATGVPRG